MYKRYHQRLQKCLRGLQIFVENGLTDKNLENYCVIVLLNMLTALRFLHVQWLKIH